LKTDKNKKLKVGVYGITGCSGCQLSIIFNEEEILAEARNWRKKIGSKDSRGPGKNKD